MPRKPEPNVFVKRTEQSKQRRILKKMLDLPTQEIDKQDWQRCYDRAKSNVIDFKEAELKDIGFTGKIIGLFSPDGEPLAYKKLEVGMSGREEPTFYKVEHPVKAT